MNIKQLAGRALGQFKPLVLVGSGNLAKALSSSHALAVNPSFQIVGVFDSDRRRIGKPVGGTGLCVTNAAELPLHVQALQCRVCSCSHRARWFDCTTDRSCFRRLFSTCPLTRRSVQQSTVCGMALARLSTTPPCRSGCREVSASRMLLTLAICLVRAYLRLCITRLLVY